MNHSIYSADRTTHLKIVVVALGCGYRWWRASASRLAPLRTTATRPRRVVKAGKAVTITSSNTSMVR